MRLLKLRETSFEEKRARASTNGFLCAPAVNVFSALVPEENAVFEVTHENGVLSFIKERRLLADAFFGSLTLRDVVADGDVLVRLPLRIKKRNDCGVNPVKAAVLSAV